MSISLMIACAAIVGWYCAVVAGYVWYIDRVEQKRTNPNSQQVDVVDVIEQFELWNDRIETKQAALDFYHELNQVCNHLFHNPLKLMITHEEFNNLTLESIKQLNRDALSALREQVSETSFN
nr:MAG TPA: hypothetical protein [Caudoviricetes sp.]